MTHERLAKKLKAEFAAIRAETAAKRQKGEKARGPDRQHELGRIIKKLVHQKIAAP